MAAPFTVLIMAAGRGTRMRSETPKVLHRLCGKPMVEWVIDAAREAGAARVVCVTRPGDGVAAGLPDGVEVAEQSRGRAPAPLCSPRATQIEAGPVAVLSGDHPLVTAEQLAGLVGEHAARGAAATILTTEELDPAGYGRIVRDGSGEVERIVETKYPDTVPADELAIREVNLGTYAVRRRAAVRGARRGRARPTASATSPASCPVHRGEAAARSPPPTADAAIASASTTAPG